MFAIAGYREISGYWKRVWDTWISSIATENQSAKVISNFLAGGPLSS